MKTETVLLLLLGIYLVASSTSPAKPGLGKLGPMSPKKR